MAFRRIVPAELDFAERYRMLTCAVQPRPIALVGTLGEQGEPNLAPFSFFIVGGVSPASVVFCPTLSGSGERKDSLRNAERAGVFGVSLPDRVIGNLFSLPTESYPKSWEVWAERGMPLSPGPETGAPLLDACPVRFECRLHAVLAHGNGPHAANYVIGEIVLASLAESLFDADRLVIERFGPLARLGGSDYLDVSSLERFDPARPNLTSAPSLDL